MEMKRSLLLIPSVLALGLLQSCGGGEPDVGFTTFNGFGVSGTVAGMREGRGDLVIRSVGDGSDTTTTISASQARYTLNSKFSFGTNVTLSVENNPQGQECTFASATVTSETNDVNNANITCVDVNYTLSGFPEISLPNGVQVSITGDRTSSVVVNGSDFTLGDDFLFGESINLAITAPNDTYNCTISPTEIEITSNVGDIDITCEQTADGLYGSLTNFSDGSGLSGVSEVSLFADNTSSFDLVDSQNTDAFGNFLFPLASTGTYSVMAVIDGYVPNGKVVLANNLNDLPRADITLLDLVQGNSINAATGGSIVDMLNTNILTIAANTLVNSTNVAASGSVASNYRTIDPSSDPSQVPGAYQTFNPTNFTRGNFETFGAGYVELKDAAGNNLDLSNGATSVIRVPLAQRLSGGVQTATKYYFDESSSYWIEDGTAELVTQNGEEYYEATVSNHSVWTVGQNISADLLTGCVTDFNGDPIANALVTAEGSTYIASFNAFTDANGNFSVPVKQGGTTFVFANKGGLSNTVTVNGSTPLTECLRIGDNSAVITLTWGENPRDLDSHFIGPSNNSGDVFHIFYINRSETVNNVPILLDVDDTSGFGPEITTMPNFPFAGRYRFAVHHFAGSSNVAESGTRVELNLNGRVRVFTPNNVVDTNAGETNTWVVFEMVSDENGNVTVIEVNNYINRQNVTNLNTSGASGSNSSGPTVSRPENSNQSYPPFFYNQKI